MKQSEIIDIVRGRIVSHQLPPGGRLPTRLELEKEFGASSVTIQKALDQLVLDGFIETFGRRGTFVSSTPPHLTRYGLIFSTAPSDTGDWNLWWEALESEARSLAARAHKDVVVVHDADPRLKTSDAYEQLADAVTSHRFAGLIFACHPFLFNNTPVLTHPGVPRIAFTGDPYLPGMGSIQLNGHAQTEKAMTFFKERGRKKLATLCNDSLDHLSHGIQQTAQAYGMETRPYWNLGTSLKEPSWAQNTIHLLMMLAPPNRPDALWIRDDNLMESACAGLLDAGVRVGKDLDVIANCNFPTPTPPPLPIKRIGFDADEMLRHALDFIDRKRIQKRSASVFIVQPYFEEDLPRMVEQKA